MLIVFLKLNLNKNHLKLTHLTARQYKSDGSKITVLYIADQDRRSCKCLKKPVVFGDTNEIAITKNVDRFFRVASISDLNVVTIKYTYLEKIDPNFKG